MRRVTLFTAFRGLVATDIQEEPPMQTEPTEKENKNEN